MGGIHDRDFCPRCLLEEVPHGEALAAEVRGWIAGIPEDSRADDACARERLARCRQCDYLSEGTCALCGCYVEYRAARRDCRCPDVPGKW